MFQAGIDRKIVKEITGHASDALNKYEITSKAQKEHISKVLSTVEVKDKEEKTCK